MTDFETKYRDLVAGLEALAETWPLVARALGPRATVTPAECYEDAAADLRALIASSPAEGTGEGEYVELVDYLNQPAAAICSGCGRSTWDERGIDQPCRMPQPDGSECAGTLTAPAPVSSGDEDPS